MKPFIGLFKKCLPYLFIVLFGLVMFYPIFRPGALVGLDSPLHLAQSYAFVENLKDHHWVFGWSDGGFAGYPLQLFPRYQLTQWLVAFVSLFGVSVELSFKLVLFFSYVFAASSLYFILSNRFSKFPSFLFSIFFLVLRRDVVLMTLNGMFGSILAAGFFLLFVHYFDRYFSRLTFRNSIKLSLLFSLTLLAHVFAAFAASYFILIYFLVYVFSNKVKFFSSDFNKKLFFSAFIPIFSFLLLAFYLGPSFDQAGWLNTNIGWPPTYNALELPYKTVMPLIFSVPKGIITHNFFAAFSSHDLGLFLRLGFSYFVSSLPQLFIFLMAVLGVFYLFDARFKNVFLVSFLFFGFLSLIFGTGFWFLFPSLKSLPLLSNFQFYRFILFANISLIVFACYAFHSLFRRSSYLPRFLSESSFFNFLFDNRVYILSAFLIFLLLNFGYFTPTKYEVATLSTIPISGNINDVLSWTSLNIRDSRIFFQDIYHNLNDSYLASSHLPGLFSYYTKVPSIGGWYDSSSYPIDRFVSSFSGIVFGKLVKDISPEELKNYLILFNCKYALAVEPLLESKFSNDLFVKEYQSGDFSIFSVKGYNPDWVVFNHTSPHNVTMLDDWNIMINFNSSVPDNEVFVKFAYHPYWKAYLDGSPLEISRNSYEMMTLHVPQGSHTVLLAYNPIRLSYLIITLITAFFSLFVLFFLD